MAMPSQYIRTGYTLGSLPSGTRGTVKTLQAMACLVREAIKVPDFIIAARCIASRANPHDQRGQVKQFFDMVSKFFYVNDPVDIEMVQGAQFSLFESGFGDCDDMAVILAALCGAIGIVSQFIVCGFDSGSNSYEHVWAQCYLEPSEFDKGGWLDLDPCADPRTGNNYMGYYARNATNFAVFPIWPELTTGLGQDEGDSVDFTDYVDSGSDTGASDPFDFSSYGVIGDANESGQYTNPLNVDTFYNPDGTQDWYYPDGSEQHWDANGQLTQFSNVNPDGTITYVDPINGTSYTEDPYGNVLSSGPATDSQKQKAATVQSSGSGGGGGSAFSPGSGGAQKAQTPSSQGTPSSVASSVQSFLNKANQAISSIFGTNTGLHTAVGPNGQPVLVNSAGQVVGTPSGNALSIGSGGAGISLNTTTLVILGLLIFAFKK